MFRINTTNIIKNKFLISLGITLLVLFLVSGLKITFGNFLSQIDFYLQNSLYTSNFSAKRDVNAKLVIVTIDDKTLQDIDK